jgi:hypothetical protein
MSWKSTKGLVAATRTPTGGRTWSQLYSSFISSKPPLRRKRSNKNEEKRRRTRENKTWNKKRKWRKKANTGRERNPSVAIVGCKNLSTFDVGTLLGPFQCGRCQVAFSNLRLSLKNFYQCQLDRWQYRDDAHVWNVVSSLMFTVRNMHLCCLYTTNNFYLELSHK